MPNSLPALSLLEARVLGTLIEKERTVPDTYPLSLNALVSGCTQKSSRNPVMAASPAEVQAAVDSLKRYNLVLETNGGRVARYAHNAERVLQVPAEAIALLAALMLRGPQTAGELRVNCERLQTFADIAAAEALLLELATRPAGPLAVELPRLPGARENRWAETLSVAASEAAHEAPAAPVVEASLGEVASLKANVARLEARLNHLQSLVGKLYAEIGMPVGAD
jgi:uncharacterized protein